MNTFCHVAGKIIFSNISLKISSNTSLYLIGSCLMTSKPVPSRPGADPENKLEEAFQVELNNNNDSECSFESVDLLFGSPVVQQSPLPLDAQNANGESSFSGSEQYNSPTFNRNIIDETGPILQEAEKNVNLSLGITKKMKACSVVINKKDLFWTKSFMVHDIVWASWGKWGWMPAIVTSKTAEILRMRFFSYNGIYKISNKNKVLHFRDKNIEDVKTSTKYESQLDNALASMNQYLNKENNIKNQ
ncbi:hypothetical protein TKK_0006082 [Trichogramma kaykai]